MASPAFEQVAPNGGTSYLNSGISVYNEYLQYRNTFIWNPQQYATNYNNAATRYTGAKLIHWLHTDQTATASTPAGTNPLTASRIPESIKEPLESRVWFNYPNQNQNVFQANNAASIGIGSTNQPSAIGRVLDDGTTQLYHFQYNNYGKLVEYLRPRWSQANHDL